MHLRTCYPRLWLASVFSARITLAGMVFAAATLTASAQATFTVTTLTDAASGVASNCSNQASGGSHDASCSLRDALAAAAALNGSTGTTAVTVNFASSLAAVGNPGTITLGANALTLPGYTTVQGLTSGSGYSLTNLITIKGNTHLTFSVGLLVTHAALNNLTLANGAPAISNSGILTVSQCTFMQNSNNSGGAIINSGTLAVLNSTFTGNSAQSYGGAIYGTGQASPILTTTQNLTVSGSTFQGNTSATDGGAIYIGINSVGSIDSSTFTGNGVAGHGAAVFINNPSGLSRITNSILNGDSGGSECQGFGCDDAARAFVFGGGEPPSVSQSGTITMTITLSSGQVFNINVGFGPFSSGASLASAFGASISNGYSPALSAQGFGSTLAVAPGSGTITSVVFNNPSPYFTITPVANSVVSGTGNTVAVGAAAANLSQLGNYGGPTQTVLPLPGSTALCAITPASATGTDQRGLPRTLAFGATLCQDSGAVQTNYGLAFAQQPGPTTVNAILSPSPSVQLSESKQNLAQANSLLTIKDSGSSLSGTTSASTLSNGIASFANLSITKAQTADTLTASLTIGTNTVSATSNPFDVLPQASATLAGNATFPLTAVGAASSQIFTFTNTGTSSISISAISVAPATDFIQTNTCGLTVSVGASCTISITFSPAVVGIRSGTLNLMSNASGYSSSVALSGTGTAAPGFTLSDNTTGATSSAITVTAGSTGTATLKVTSINGFAGSVALACAAQGTAPMGLACNVFSPVTLAAGGTATATVTITTTARTVVAGIGAVPRRGFPAYLLVVALLSAALLRLRSWGRTARAVGLLVLLLALGVGLNGCGSGGTFSFGTPVGTYNYTVTATAPGITATQTLAITVQ